MGRYGIVADGIPLDGPKNEGHQLVNGLEAGGPAGIHVLHASLEGFRTEIGFGPELKDKIAAHIGLRIGPAGRLSR